MAAKRRRPPFPPITDLLDACEEAGAARFFGSGDRDPLTLGIQLGTGTLIAVQAGNVGDDESELVLQVREARGIAFLVTRDVFEPPKAGCVRVKQAAFVRSRAGADVPVGEDETILETWFRIVAPGERKNGFRIPGTNLDVEHRDGQVLVGSGALGVLGAMQVPKDGDVKAIAGQFWDRLVGRR
jgi:hypothetical protein